jgi:hypothetical protein
MFSNSIPLLLKTRLICWELDFQGKLSGIKGPVQFKRYPKRLLAEKTETQLHLTVKG